MSLDDKVFNVTNLAVVYSNYVMTNRMLYYKNSSDLTYNKCDEILKDSPGPPPMYDMNTRYLIAGILFIFPCLTLFGSGMVIVAVYTHKRLQTITNAFVVSLAFADLMVAILVMPFGIYQQYNNKTWNLGRQWCLVTTSFDVMFTTTSIFNLSCLAVDRYLAICRPFVHETLTRRKVAFMIFVCWFVPVFISFVPIMNSWNLVGIEDFIECTFPADDTTHCIFFVNKAFAIVCSMIAFYIPAVFIIICYIYIYRAARRQAYHICNLELAAHKEHRRGKLKHETKAAKTVGIIIGCFFVCWFPFFGLNVIDPFIGYRIPYLPWTVALWLGYINSMLNPFLYYNFNKHFKMAFRRLLTGKFCRGVNEFEDDIVPSIPSHVYTDVSHADNNGRANSIKNGNGNLKHRNS